MTVTEQTTQQTLAASSSSAHASVELSERGGSVSIDGTFHALRASNVEDAVNNMLLILRTPRPQLEVFLLEALRNAAI